MRSPSPIVRFAPLLFITQLPLPAADFSWDGEPGVTVGTTTTQFGPATGSVWISGQVAASSNWTVGNGITGANTPWINDPASIAQFKSATNGTVPASLSIALGENITLNKIDVGGSFVPLTLTNSGANTFTITLAQNGANAPTLAPNKPLTVDVVLAGTSGLAKINAETATLTKANTYTGTTSITTGTLAGTNALSFSTSAISVTGTGQAWLNGALTFANAITLNAGNTAGALRLTNATASGPITLAGNSFITAAGSTGTISSVIDDGGTAKGLTFVDGIINLTGTAANTYTGTTTLTLGTLNLNKTAGINAIGGNLQVNGGSVTWVAANQVADTANITVSAGAINSANKSDTIANLTINSPTASTFSGLNVTNTLTVTTGTHDAVNSGGLLQTKKAILSGNSLLQLGANSGNSNWEVGTGGLEMNGATIKFGNAGATPFQANLKLLGDVTATGTNTLASGVSGATVGTAAQSIDLQGGTRTFAINSGTTTVESKVAITNGTLVKSGAGTLVVNSPGTFAGGTTISGGAFLANNATGSATGTGSVLVSTGGILAGGGRIAGPTTISGTLSPGSTAALTNFGMSTLAFDGNLTFAAGSALTLEYGAPSSNNPAVASNPALLISNPGPGAQQDFLSVTGNLQLNSSQVITLSLGSYTPQVGDIFDLFDVPTANLSLNGFNPATGITVNANSGVTLDTSKFQDYGVVIVTAVVPEPSQMLLGAATLLGLAMGRRRKC